VVHSVVVLAPLARTTYTSTRLLVWSQLPSALAQVAVVVVAQVVQRLAAQVRQVDAVQEAEEEEAHRQEHAVLVVLAAMASSSFTKCSPYEQSLRDTRWHSPQHHRP
jgi:uncharacterized heparinase superfamily protein